MDLQGKGPGKGGGKGIRGNCWLCGEAGHRAVDCPKTASNVRSAEQEEEVTHAKRAEISDTWGICQIELGNSFSGLIDDDDNCLIH